VAALKCTPKEITWETNVSVLCFGGTKNGLAAGELVIFFEKGLANDFDYRLKQAGQLPSKMRFLAAAWLGLLTSDAWLRNASHANRMARRLAADLQTRARIEPVIPVEANAVFVRLSEPLVRGLQGLGWQFYKFIDPDIYRLMCSWSTDATEIETFIVDVVCIQNELSL
jgi:threonine aldolase